MTVASTGGIATHTPADYMFGNTGLRWNPSITTKPCGLPGLSTRDRINAPECLDEHRVARGQFVFFRYPTAIQGLEGVN